MGSTVRYPLLISSAVAAINVAACTACYANEDVKFNYLLSCGQSAINGRDVAFVWSEPREGILINGRYSTIYEHYSDALQSNRKYIDQINFYKDGRVTYVDKNGRADLDITAIRSLFGR